jgi:two-component system sensor histidine kinase DevS
LIKFAKVRGRGAINDTSASGLSSLLGPYHLARYATAAALVATVAVVWLSLLTPVSDVAFRQAADGRVAVATPSERFTLRADAPVALRGVGGAVMTRPALELTTHSAASTPERQRLAAMLKDGPVTAQATDANGERRAVVISVRDGRISDLTATYWQSVLCGAISMLFGIAIWLIRRRDWAAACFAWIGVWLFASSAADALVELWNIATPRGFVAFTLVANAATLHPFALSFAALFTQFPTPLVSRQVLWRILAVVGAAAVATVVAVPWNTSYSTGLQMAVYGCLLALVIGQLWFNRSDAAKRPTLITLVGSITIGILLYLLITLLPMLAGIYAPLGEAVAFPLFCLIYAGIGLSIVGKGVFALDGWSRSIMLSITFSGVVLLVDLILLRWLTQQQDVALGLSVAGVTLAWLPVREWFSRRAERRRDAQTQRALRLATDLAFATTDEERATRWRAAVDATFRSLETSVDPEPAEEPRIEERGVALKVPAVAGAPALVCRHADGGRRAYRRDDIEAAKALVSIVARMVEARDAYLNGVAEERGRIARDLHDNVSGRLLTSLHRRDVPTMQHDVRDAMADIRTIITGLDGGDRRLGELLADLRYECVARCDGGGLTLDWPMGDELEDARPVSYAFCRHLTALVRESVSNILRHAAASRVEVRIVPHGERLLITITDDGRGLSAADRRGRGLANCADRAGLLGGRFETLPSDRGAAIRFEVSLS